MTVHTRYLTVIWTDKEQELAQQGFSCYDPPGIRALQLDHGTLGHALCPACGDDLRYRSFSKGFFLAAFAVCLSCNKAVAF